MAEGFTCPVDERYRSACKDLSKYPGSRFCVLHAPVEEKQKEDFEEEVKKSKLDRKDYDFSGTVFPEGTTDFEGFEFDANAYFAGATFIGDTIFARAQFSGESTFFIDAQFRGKLVDFRRTQFSGESTSFLNAQFSGEKTSFRAAQFSSEETQFLGAHFSGESTSFLNAQFSGERTSFSGAQFSSEETQFLSAQFSGARTDFPGAQFNSSQATGFSAAQFNGESTSFLGAKFGSASTLFSQTSFAKEVVFREATFEGRVAFWGIKEKTVFASEAWASFDSVRTEKPELLAFHNVLLHPGWFINIDVRKVDFTDVKWYGMPGGPKGTLNEEIDNLKRRDIESPHSLLAQACRRLSANAEENREYPLANEFHYWSMDALRKEGSGRLGLIGTLYWALSGYGVRAAQAFWMLVGIWAVFTTLYVLVNPSEFGVFRQGVCYFWQAGVYSLLAIARLNPEPRPDEPGLFQLLVGLEGIFGPLQIALLALAIRRKVMR